MKDSVSTISIALIQIEKLLWNMEGPFNFTDGTLRSACKIFSDVLMDKMFELQERENLSMDDRINMANKLGCDIKNMVETYCGINTKDFYKKDEA